MLTQDKYNISFNKCQIYISFKFDIVFFFNSLILKLKEKLIMKKNQDFLNYNVNEILPYIHRYFLDKNNFKEEIFNNQKRWASRAYFLSASILPVFIYLRDNNLLSDTFRDYRTFISLENLVNMTKSHLIPDYLKSSIVFYLTTIPNLTYEMLESEDFTEIVREQHGYLQVLYSNLNIEEEMIIIETLKSSFNEESEEKINEKIEVFLNYNYQMGDSGWIGRYLKLSNSMLPAFLYFRDSGLFHTVDKYNFVDFLDFDIIIECYNSVFLPKNIKEGILGYLNTLPEFDISILKHDISSEFKKSEEHHNYIKMAYWKLR